MQTNQVHVKWMSKPYNKLINEIVNIITEKSENPIVLGFAAVSVCGGDGFEGSTRKGLQKGLGSGLRVAAAVCGRNGCCGWVETKRNFDEEAVRWPSVLGVVWGRGLVTVGRQWLLSLVAVARRLDCGWGFFDDGGVQWNQWAWFRVSLLLDVGMCPSPNSFYSFLIWYVLWLQFFPPLCVVLWVPL